MLSARYEMDSGRTGNGVGRRRPAKSGRSCVRDATFGMTGREVELTSLDGAHKVTKSR
jgi:hypothetical protein